MTATADVDAGWYVDAGYGDVVPSAHSRLSTVVLTFMLLASMSVLIEAMVAKQTQAMQNALRQLRTMVRPRSAGDKVDTKDPPQGKVPPNEDVALAADVKIATRQVLVSGVAVGVVVVGGGVLYSVFEGWSLVQGVYFCTVTLSSVGYGDFIPSSELSRVLWLPFVCVGLGTVTVFLSALTDLLAARSKRGRMATVYRLEASMGYRPQAPDHGVVVQDNAAVRV